MRAWTVSRSRTRRRRNIFVSHFIFAIHRQGFRPDVAPGNWHLEICDRCMEASELLSDFLDNLSETAMGFLRSVQSGDVEARPSSAESAAAGAGVGPQAHSAAGTNAILARDHTWLGDLPPFQKQLAVVFAQFLSINAWISITWHVRVTVGG